MIRKNLFFLSLSMIDSIMISHVYNMLKRIMKDFNQIQLDLNLICKLN